MAGKACLRKYRQRLKSSRVSQRQLLWANAARKELYNSEPIIRQRARQCGKTTAFNTKMAWMLAGARYLSSPSGAKVVEPRIRFNTLTLPVKKDEPWLSQFETLFRKDLPQYTTLSSPAMG